MLILLCDSFIISGLNPTQKSNIVKLVKNLPEHPVTLAIGAGIGDIQMMHHADISVNIENQNICSDVIARSTISCADLSSVFYLLL